MKRHPDMPLQYPLEQDAEAIARHAARVAAALSRLGPVEEDDPDGGTGAGAGDVPSLPRAAQHRRQGGPTKA